jgi:hypothetical protein
MNHQNYLMMDQLDRNMQQIQNDEKMPLMRIYGPRRDGVTGGWRGLHYEEPHRLYCSPSIIRTAKVRNM